jgi:hypothetical protein
LLILHPLAHKMMNLIQQIRTSAGNYFLKKGISSLKRTKKLVNINSASSIGLLFELTDESVYYSIQKYFIQFQEKKIKVKAMGFASNKLVTHHFLPVLSFDFFNSKQVNWFNIPRAQCIQDFIETEFDICINIASEKIFPLKYISGMSKARLKVGSYNSEMPGRQYKEQSMIYDIMLRTEENHEQIKFLENIHEYLNLLNPKENV